MNKIIDNMRSNTTRVLTVFFALFLFTLSSCTVIVYDNTNDDAVYSKHTYNFKGKLLDPYNRPLFGVPVMMNVWPIGDANDNQWFYYTTDKRGYFNFAVDSGFEGAIYVNDYPSTPAMAAPEYTNNYFFMPLSMHFYAPLGRNPIEGLLFRFKDDEQKRGIGQGKSIPISLRHSEMGEAYSLVEQLYVKGNYKKAIKAAKKYKKKFGQKSGSKLGGIDALVKDSKAKVKAKGNINDETKSGLNGDDSAITGDAKTPKLKKRKGLKPRSLKPVKKKVEDGDLEENRTRKNYEILEEIKRDRQEYQKRQDKLREQREKTRPSWVKEKGQGSESQSPERQSPDKDALDNNDSEEPVSKSRPSPKEDKSEADRGKKVKEPSAIAEDAEAVDASPEKPMSPADVKSEVAEESAESNKNEPAKLKEKDKKLKGQKDTQKKKKNKGKDTDPSSDSEDDEDELDEEIVDEDIEESINDNTSENKRGNSSNK